MKKMGTDSVIEQQNQERVMMQANGLYDSQFEKDACGMGFVVNIGDE